jgi:putative Ca2+/H+ antiporter (TMEM165/GDT1 family)
MVLAGVMMALFLLSLMAIYLGRYLSSRIDRKLLSRAAGAIFLLIGSSSLLSALASSL